MNTPPQDSLASCCFELPQILFYTVSTLIVTGNLYLSSQDKRDNLGEYFFPLESVLGI